MPTFAQTSLFTSKGSQRIWSLHELMQAPYSSGCNSLCLIVQYLDVESERAKQLLTREKGQGRFCSEPWSLGAMSDHMPSIFLICWRTSRMRQCKAQTMQQNLDLMSVAAASLPCRLYHFHKDNRLRVTAAFRISNTKLIYHTRGLLLWWIEEN